MIDLTKPFEVGRRYFRLDGKIVTCIKTVSNLKGYETAQFDDREEAWASHNHPMNDHGHPLDSGFRYNRASDRGRCTGCEFDDPFNVIPEPNPNLSKEHLEWLFKPFQSKK